MLFNEISLVLCSWERQINNNGPFSQSTAQAFCHCDLSYKWILDIVEDTVCCLILSQHSSAIITKLTEGSIWWFTMEEEIIAISLNILSVK